MSENQYQLTVRKGPIVGEIFLLDLPIITIGRDPIADIVINDPEISRQHTRFTRTPTGFSVQDLGSTNGTFINGERIGGDPVNLQPNQTVSMGSGVTLIYEQIEVATNYLTPTDHETDPSEGFFYVPADTPKEELANPPSYQQYEYAQPITTPPVESYSYTSDTPSNNQPPNKNQRNIIIAVSAFLLLCCCCSFLLFMWFYAGDILLQQMGLIP